MSKEEIKIKETTYKVGDKVWYGLDYGTENQNTFREGYVAFGEFSAEIYTCYGFYVADNEGNQVSEAGLTEEYLILNKDD